MLQSLGIDEWRDVLHNEELHREMAAYTGDDISACQEPPVPDPAGVGTVTPCANMTIESLPFFMKE